MTPASHDAADPMPVSSGSLARQQNAEPIPGYRLIERLGSGGFGEVWKCEAPGGLFKAMKIVHGDLGGVCEGSAPAEQELQSLQRVKLIRHPFILSVERVEIVRGHLVIITELADRNLHEVCADFNRAGRPGIPRGELLAYLREAAEALDWMSLKFGLQHLDVKPQNLFLVSNHVKVADFGLVSSLWEKTGGDAAGRPVMGGTTPPYSPPEVFRGAISPFSDQYSLAIVYQELLTGQRPFNGKNARQLAVQHDRSEPDLSPVPVPDRPVLARALAKDPKERFPTCMAFVEALASAEGPRFAGTGALETTPVGNQPETPNGVCPSLPSTPWHRPGQASSGALAAATDEDSSPAAGGFRAGLEFRRCLDHRALCEVWTALAPGGRERLVKFVHSFGRSNSRAEAEAVARLTALTHPGLERLEVASHRPGSLLLATDPPGQSLGDAFQDSRLNGLPGVPRWDLLRYLATAAEALDYLASHHGIQHLGLNPGNLFVGSDHCLVADAGLVQLLWLPAGHSPFQLNALYSAPELFDRRVAPGADQFSLALIYLEMLTGQHPQLGLSPRKLAKARRAGKIDLARLPAAEREVVARALHPDPGQRFRRCTEFVAALEALSAGERPLLRGLPPVISAMWPCLPAGFSGPVARPEDVITELIASAQGSVKRNDGSDWSFSLDGEEQLHCHFMVEGTPAELRSRLDAFCRQWNARVVCADPHYLLCQVGLPRGFLQRCIGRGYGLEIHVHLQPRATTAASLSEVQLQVKALRCSGAQAEALLEEVGPVLVNSLRGQMHPQAEQRGQERQVCRSIVRVHPVLHNFLLGQAIECKARDVSLGGVGFLAPRPMPTPQFYIELLKEPAAPLTAVLARVVRERPADDGCYDVGAAFCLDGCG